VLGIHAIYEGVNILDDDKLSDGRRMPKGEVLLLFRTPKNIIISGNLQLTSV
jgi:hypothetical protein